MLRFVFGVFVLLGLSSGAEAQSDLCADPSAVCAGKLPPRCLQKFAAGAIAVGDQCEPAMAAYRGCLTEAAAKCSGGRAQTSDPDREAQAERAYNSVKDSGDAALLEIIAKRYPNTVWGEIAARQAAALKPAAAVAPARTATEPRPAPPPAAGGAKPALAKEFRDCDVCPVMLEIPGGRFTMGSPSSEPRRNDDEGPQRRVTIQPFAMGKYEVTFEEWDACVSAGGCSHRPKDDWGRGRQPVVRVSWNDAQDYVRWLNRKVGSDVYRLPSEAEWEYAARAGSTTPFWWGASITPRQANYDGTSSYNGSPKGAYRQRTVAVGSFSANPFGVHDVHGNVWEWVQDCSNDSYRGAPTNGSAWVSGDCSIAVLRGGSWISLPWGLRSANRFRNGRDLRGNLIGFRVARVSRTLR